MYNKQMEMFQDGGLKDQGNTTDPVSGNDVPSGSLKEEVRDDIDAKLSPGEFVFPADVVRFIGLEKLMMIRDKAKKGLSRMEEMGQMGNSDEATIDDDVPFGMEDLIIVSGGPENEMSKGGVPSYGRGGQLIGDIGDGYQPPTRYHNPATGQEMMVTKIAGKFFPPLPKGFVPKPTLAQANPTSSTRVGTTSVLADDQYDETVPGDPVNTNINSDGTMASQESAGGEQRGNAGTEKSVDEMTPQERADYGDWSLANPTLASMVFGFADVGTAMMKGQFGSPISMVSNIAQRALGVADIEIGIGTMNRATVERIANLRKSSPEAYAQLENDFNRNQMTRAININRDNDIPTVSLTQVTGASPKDIADLQDQISRGNVAPGAVAVGPNTHVNIGQYGAVVHRGEIIAGKFADEMKAKAEAAVRASKFGSTSSPMSPGAMGGKTGPDPAGGYSAPAGQAVEAPGSTNTPQNPSGGPDTAAGAVGGFGAAGGYGGGAMSPGGMSGQGGADGSEDGGVGGGAEIATGGLISKKLKKKQKKMKRGGLASRK